MEHNGSHGYTVSLLDHDDKEKLMEVQRLRYTYLLREFDAGKNDPYGLDDDGYDAFSDSIIVSDAETGMIVGTLIMTVFGSAFNAIYLLPKFSALFGMPMEAIIGMGTKVNSAINSVSTLVLFAVVPFNLLKGAVVSLLTFLLYKRISPILHRGDERRRERNAGRSEA